MFSTVTRYLFCISIIWIVFTAASRGQLSVPGKPYPVIYKGSTGIPVYPIETGGIQKRQATINSDDLMLKPAQSGALIETDFNPFTSGVWDTLYDGTKLWRAAFLVENASVMNLMLSPFRVNSGVKIFIYDPEQQYIIGAFSDHNNKPYDLLATGHVPGNIIVIEMQVPAHLEDYGRIGIKGIGCDFAGDGPSLKKDIWYGASGLCNIDIACAEDPLIVKIKNSVVRIIFQGHERCTGVLVNTTQNIGVHYILTAGHCFEKEEDANSAVFYFGYESPRCDGPDGNSSRSLSGATIRAHGGDIDFALLELLEPVPVSYQPYYAGWDYTNTAPQSGVAIHHPLGDVKKIAFEDHPLTVASFGGHYNNNTHWLVSRWESGTTEAGSSGAPFFDEHGRIRGTLTGGSARCGNPVNDYFQMFSHSWMDYIKPEEQLAIWLDPLKLTKGYLDGSDQPGENYPAEEYVTVYPNPATSVVRLMLKEMIQDDVQVTMYNMQGQVVLDKDYGPYQHIIPLNLQGISTGIYIVRVKQGRRVENIKLMITK